MRTALLAIAAAACAWSQAQPVVRTWIYSSTPTAGDCTAANYGHRAINTNPSTALDYVCTKRAGAAAWVMRPAAVYLPSDVTNSDASANTIADVTGLSFPVTSGVRYRFRFVIGFTAAASTTGSRFSVSGPASPTDLNYYSGVATNNAQPFQWSFANAYDQPAAAATTSAATSGNTAIIEGIIKPSASGTVIARFASEVSSSAIVAKAGISYVEWAEIP